jgi:hypothetical protein
MLVTDNEQRRSNRRACAYYRDVCLADEGRFHAEVLVTNAGPGATTGGPGTSIALPIITDDDLANNPNVMRLGLARLSMDAMYTVQSGEQGLTFPQLAEHSAPPPPIYAFIPRWGDETDMTTEGYPVRDVDGDVLYYTQIIYEIGIP